MANLMDRWLNWDETPDLALDVIEQPDALIVKASLPGFSEKDIDVSVRGDQLVIAAKAETASEQEGVRWYMRERRSQQYYRTLPIPAELRDKPANAELENGVLTIRLLKRKPGPLEALKSTVKRILPLPRETRLKA